MFRRLSILGLAGVLVLVGGGLTMAFAGNNITTPKTLVDRNTDQVESCRCREARFHPATCSCSSAR